MSLNPTFIGQIGASIQKPHSGPKQGPMIGRVTHVVQGPYMMGTNIPDYYYNGPTSIGVITFQLLEGIQDRTLDSAGNTTAKPINSALKQYPLEGEFVYVMPGPSVNMNTSRGTRDFYYFPPFNIWNASHHNAFPDLGDYGEYLSTINRNYQDSTRTNQPVNTSATGSLTMPLGPNFPESATLKSLRQFTGDVTIEGRWGNSIRFGSTNAGPEASENYWSSVNTGNTAGSPITIIRNGQGKQENDIAWIPTVENINVDPSSIYLTNGQKIVVDDIDNNFSLISLGVNLNSTVTVAIPIQQQVTSFDTLSPNEQDNRVKGLNS
jgi:hypothetical protein